MTNIYRDKHNSLTKRVTLVVIGFVVVFSTTFQMTQIASADPYDDRIIALQQQISTYQARATELSGQIMTLQQEISKLQNQVSEIQAQIDLSQAQYDKLVAQIADTEKKIKDNQDALGLTIANLYVESDITPLEMIASSKNISDYMDKQEYRNSVRNQLTATITQIKDLKVQLESQKTDVQAVLTRQQSERTSLVANQNQQQKLLNDTQGQESVYQQLVSDNKRQVEEINAQQRAYYQSLLNSGRSVNNGTYGSFQFKNWSGNQGCSGGYTFCQPQDSIIDPWQLYNRECVSYVAWALQNRGKYVEGFHGSGNASQWPSSAIWYSGASIVSNPQVNDAVVLGQIPGFTSSYGHVMIIDSIGSDGWLNVSQYNMYGSGEYSTMSIKFDINDPAIAVIRFQNR